MIHQVLVYIVGGSTGQLLTARGGRWSGCPRGAALELWRVFCSGQYQEVGVGLARVMHLKLLCSKLQKLMDLHATCGAGTSVDIDIIL